MIYSIPTLLIGFLDKSISNVLRLSKETIAYYKYCVPKLFILLLFKFKHKWVSFFNYLIEFESNSSPFVPISLLSNITDSVVRFVSSLMQSAKYKDD